MTRSEAMEKARHIPMPQTGEIINISSIEVFCAFMELHKLEIREWRGSFVVMRHAPALEAGKEEEHAK